MLKSFLNNDVNVVLSAEFYSVKTILTITPWQE